MRVRESIAWMTNVIQNNFLAQRLRRLSDLREELEVNAFLTREERAVIKQKIADHDAAIAQERVWSPSGSLIAELERLEREGSAFGEASFAANLHQVRDIVRNPAKGEYKPSSNDDLYKRSAVAAEKLARLAEKHRIPLDGLDSLRRWNLLGVNGRYIGGIGSR